MEELVTIIVNYVSIWMPALTAVIGIISAVIIAIGKVKTAVSELKQDDTIKGLRKDLEASIKENKAIREQYDIIIDELKNIKAYRENKKHD